MKTTRIFVAIIIFLTLLLNLINLSLTITYENTYAKHNRDLVNFSDASNLQQVCAQIKEPIEGYMFSDSIALLSLCFIMISFLIFLLIFLLAKFKKISLSNKDWKWFRISIFIAFISVFIFLYAFWIASDNSYLVRCLYSVK